MAGNKTHEQQLRQFENKEDIPREGVYDRHPEKHHSKAPQNEDKRQSEFAVSRQGMTQEDRNHNHPTDGNGSKKH